MISDIDFERETKVKYRRSSNVPDYRHTMYTAEPKYANVPVFAPIQNGVNGVNGNSSRRNSESPNGAQQPVVDKGKGKASRRNSDLLTSATKANGASPKKSRSPAAVRRSESPDTSRNGVMSYPAAKNGTVSPLTYRSISPNGIRSGAVSPMTARHGTASPAVIRNGAISPIAGSSTPINRNSSPSGQDGAGSSQPQARNMLQKKAAARRQVQSLPALDTQPSPRPQSQGSNGSEEFDEVISLSPAVRAPVKKFRRMSSARNMSAHPDSSTQGLDSILENGNGGPYSGQDINPEDLVAVNLENAFDRL